MFTANDYTVGKGKLYFRPFLPGTQTPELGGFRYFGNVPELNVTQAEEKLDHVSSEGGINVKDDSLVTAQDQSVSFTTDNVSLDNLALWLRSSVSTITEAGSVGVVQAFADIVCGTFYQIGQSPTLPQGSRNTTITAATKGVTPLVAGTDYVVDVATGLVRFLDSANLSDGDDVSITYTVAAGTRKVVLAGTDTLEGELKFIADNPKGSNKDKYWPRVQLSPDGDYGLITEEWAQISFTGEVLQRSDGAALSYTEKR
jgi:hypothetical protein